MSLNLTEKSVGERSRLGFSGSDFVPIIMLSGEAFYDVPLSTITVSFYTDKVPSRVLGSRYPKNYRLNQITYSGTLISILRNSSPFYSIIDMLRRDRYLGYDIPLKTFELPAMDIIMLGINEAGAMTYSSVVGASIVQGGYTFSINDVYTEVVMQYTALDFFEPTPILINERADEAGFTNDILYRHYDIFGLMTENGIYVSRILGLMQSLRRKMLATIKLINDPSVTNDIKDNYLSHLDKYRSDYSELANKLETARRSYRFDALQTTLLSDGQTVDSIKYSDEKVWGASGKSNIESALYAGTTFWDGELDRYLSDVTEPMQSPIVKQNTINDIDYYLSEFERASSIYHNGGRRDVYVILVKLENEIYQKYPSDMIISNPRIRSILANIQNLKDEIRNGGEVGNHG